MSQVRSAIERGSAGVPVPRVSKDGGKEGSATVCAITLRTEMWREVVQLYKYHDNMSIGESNSWGEAFIIDEPPSCSPYLVAK